MYEQKIFPTINFKGENLSENMENAIILVSGGLDSVTLSHYLKKVENIKKLKLIFIDYNQKCLEEELYCAKKLAKELNSDLKIINAKWLGEISTSLINKESDKGIEEIKQEEEIISWYVPCRNALFLLIGLAIAEAELISNGKKYDVYLGIKHEGELQFKDTTPEFIDKINNLVEFCTQKGDFKFVAPFLKKEKEELIELCEEFKIPLENTYSCYIGGGFRKVDGKKVAIHCGICGGCKSRKKAFKFSEVNDPTIYEN